MEFMKKIDIFEEDFNIPDEYISARLHWLFTKSAKKWYYKIRQDHGKHSWTWWKEQIISKWENASWRFRMEISFEEAIFNIERDRPMSWFLKQKDRLTALHPDMSEKMVHKGILRKGGGGLEHAIRRSCIEPCSTEDYINSMEDITTRAKIGRNWYKPPIDNKTSGKPILKPNKPQDRAPLKCHKCGKELIQILFQYKEAFASDNEPIGDIKGHELDIILNLERSYPTLLRRPTYPAGSRAREALESHINELMKLGVLRKAGHNEELEVTTPVIITWNNDKSRMVGYFRESNTYTITDRYSIPIIHETLTQLSKERLITSMDSLKRFHPNVLTPHSRKLLRIISHCEIYEYLRIPFGIEMHPLIIKE
ncbi:hypothetical protein O181_087173 [Austropuccinia psidii MF-1]|uniref:Uncharacterized protein n=1 Tax=Austropuccinia psidii MF-1 TaxID=1389203 RepID=A0A9Q3P0P4_9BASI|nr:hypothetical protein [Austropuccinia psidii MF-1]